MSKTSAKTQKPSALDNFNLAFEYDVSWRDIKKTLKERTS